MKNYMKKLFRGIAVLTSLILLAGITSLITTKKTVWITVKRNGKVSFQSIMKMREATR